MTPEQLKNYNILYRAREDAMRSDRHCDSEQTRKLIIERFKQRFDNKPPYDWQTDATEALKLGLDVTLIADTGSGKTMLFFMPLLLDDTNKKMVLIISPLKELQKDMVRNTNHIP
jgi:Lhr-like helicase